MIIMIECTVDKQMKKKIGKQGHFSVGAISLSTHIECKIWCVAR